MKLDHHKINQLINDTEHLRKKLTISELAALTGYTYQQLYFNGYKKLASKRKRLNSSSFRELPINASSEVAPHESKKKHEAIAKEEAKKASPNPVDLTFHMGSKTLSINIQDVTEANIDDTIEDLEFIFKKVIQKLNREKASLQSSNVQGK